MLVQRLRADFKLAVVMLFGIITILGVTPFAIYRFASGAPLVGAIDLAIVLSISVGVGYAWRTGRTGGTTLFLAIIYTVGCVAVAHLIGVAGVLWTYPVLLANFLLARSSYAVAVSALAVLGVATCDLLLANPAHQVVFIATAFVVSLFAYVFASRTEMQRLQLEAVAAHDPLTGAYNRRGMGAELTIAMAGSIRTRSPLGLLVFDLDRFKLVNDRYGHEAGDLVLVRIADLVRGSTRIGDRFFRLGGEEFGLLVPGVDSGSLAAVAETLRAAVEQEIHCGDQPVTISIGATLFIPGESAADLLARADEAMYQAKREGRNRVVCRIPGEHYPPSSAAAAAHLRHRRHPAQAGTSAEANERRIP